MQSVLPDKFGKFEVVREIGRGGFGVVYEGRDPVLKRKVAIKTCSSKDESLRQRFQREAEMVASLQHPNITTVHDLGVEDGIPYLVQEYLSGRDLSELIKEKKAVPLQRKLAILAGVASGLEQAHKRGIIHRDIKPGNVRLLEDGSVKVMDFGIAKLAAAEETQLTEAGMMIGTAAYLAPEQVSDTEVDHRCDIFSFGVVAYELLSYQRPFRGTTISALLYKINHDEHEPLSTVASDAPAEIAALIDDCLSKEPDDRPLSFTEVLRRLRGQPVAPRPTGATKKMAKPTDATKVMGSGPGQQQRAAAAAAAAEVLEGETVIAPAPATTLTGADPQAQTIMESRETTAGSSPPPGPSERAMTESSMSQMFSKASKPSVIAVAAMAVIAVGAVWFGLTRGGDSEGPSRGEVRSGEETNSAAGGSPSGPDASPSLTPENESGAGDPASADAALAEQEAADSGPVPSTTSTESTRRTAAANQPTPTRSTTPARTEAGSTRRSDPDPPRQTAPARTAPSGTVSSEPTPPSRSTASRSTSTETPRSTPTSTPTRSAPAESTTRSATSSQSSTGSSSSEPSSTRPTSTRPTSTGSTSAGSTSTAPASEPTRDPTSSSTQRTSASAAAASASETASQRPSASPSPSQPVAESAVPEPTDHVPALRVVLERYADAIRAMDGRALKAVWPSLSRRQLRRIEGSFNNAQAMDINITNCSFAVSGSTATADCRVARTITPKAGRRQSNTSTTTFRFRQAGSGWVLDSV